MAPPLTLTRSMSGCSSFSQARITEANALVGRDGLVAGDRLARLLVARARRHGHDLALEAALGRGPGGPLLAAGAERVEILAGQTPSLGDDLGGDALGDEAPHRGVA